MTENPFTKIESRFDSLEQSFDDLKRAILGNPIESSAKDIGGVEVATDETGLSSHSIYRLVSQRKIPHSKRLGRLYFSRKTLRQWIADGQRKTT
jgi:predicted DNA-binding transcriptional regulator AlpA